MRPGTRFSLTRPRLHGGWGRWSGCLWKEGVDPFYAYVYHNTVLSVVLYSANKLLQYVLHCACVFFSLPVDIYCTTFSMLTCSSSRRDTRYAGIVHKRNTYIVTGVGHAMPNVRACTAFYTVWFGHRLAPSSPALGREQQRLEA